MAVTSKARNSYRLRNRTALPRDTDFDPRVTLDEILQAGDDTNRWSTDRAGRIQGLVLDVEYARPEATNCFNPCRLDVHIVLAKGDEAPKSAQVILELTPNLLRWANAQGIDWSAETLRPQLVGHWCEFEGWMYFDTSHSKDAENTAPGRHGNWRASAWELHPVTKVGKCD